MRTKINVNFEERSAFQPVLNEVSSIETRSARTACARLPRRGIIRISPRPNQCSFRVTIEARVPVIPLRGCVPLLGVHENAVMDLVLDGQLRWAWDLRARAAKRAYVVILAESLSLYQKAPEQIAPPTTESQDEMEWGRVLEMVLPHQKPILRASEFTHAFAVTSGHTMNLIRDGLLTPLNAKRLRTQSPVVTRESVVRFLRERRIE